jgi:hypothetical protein
VHGGGLGALGLNDARDELGERGRFAFLVDEVVLAQHILVPRGEGGSGEGAIIVGLHSASSVQEYGCVFARRRWKRESRLLLLLIGLSF